MNVQTKPKAFSWSYSKLKNYETCPRRYQAVDLEKTVEQGRSEALDRGDDMHEAMRLRVASGESLPAHFLYMERWAEKLTSDLHPYQIIQTELKLSTDKEGNPTSYFDRTTWLRGKIDYLRIVPNEDRDVGHVVDYKTGKPPRVWDGTQLMLSAHLVFAHYQKLDTLRVDYLWTEYNDTSHANYTRAEVPKEMEQLLPRVTKMEMAHINNEFEAKPCGLCKDYCPVQSCEYYGKGLRR